MKEDKGDRGRHTGTQDSRKSLRENRLKLALRENLKRRKSQARGRSDAIAAPSDDADIPLHDGGANKPER